MTLTRRIAPLALLTLLAGALAGCSSGGSDDATNPPSATLTRSVASRPSPTPAATVASTVPASTTSVSATPTRPATQAPAATATMSAVAATATSTVDATIPPTTGSPAWTATTGGQPARGALDLVEQGFSEVQEHDEVAFGFVVENPRATEAVVSVRYVVTAFEGATALEAFEGYLDYVPPAARLGVGGSIVIADDADADRIEIELLEGETVEPWFDAGFTVANVAYQSVSLFPSATAIVSTTSDLPLQDFEVYALAYDASGAIIGGGYTFVSFILAGGSVGVEVILSAAEEPERVEIYPAITSLTMFGLEESSAPDAAPLVVAESGFGTSVLDGEIGWGFIIENPNPVLAADTAAYHVTAYSVTGNVLGVYASYIALLLPGERLGVAGSFYLPPGETVDRVEVQALGRYFAETTLVPGFLTTSSVELIADDFSPRVTGVVLNSLDRDLTDIEVYALAYDESGAIIGGGYTFIDLVPAGGEAPAEVTLAAPAEPARVELYATVSGLSGVE